MFVPQALQRTSFPRALTGTARIERQLRFGHMIRTVCDCSIANTSLTGATAVDPRSLPCFHRLQSHRP